MVPPGHRSVAERRRDDHLAAPQPSAMVRTNAPSNLRDDDMF
jgi:hypothetical protein